MLLDRAGRTDAEDAGIRLADPPAPLYRPLVLSGPALDPDLG
ncbi:hypothetical protein [Pseudonocardia aurantiaca]|uniref:Uncharacterized protein n=1 Tax=Pseudonocardia aurantiaca TaxID=75290 RepID=A0ABW4FN90_9PSEU